MFESDSPVARDRWLGRQIKQLAADSTEPEAITAAATAGAQQERARVLAILDLAQPGGDMRAVRAAIEAGTAPAEAAASVCAGGTGPRRQSQAAAGGDAAGNQVAALVEQALGCSPTGGDEE